MMKIIAPLWVNHAMMITSLLLIEMKWSFDCLKSV